MLKFCNVTKKYHYSQFAVFDNLSFDLDKNKVHTLLIDQQSGKTTICKLVMAIEQPDSGNIFLDEIDICGTKGSDKSIAYLGSDLLLFDNKTVAFNILYPLRLRKIDKATQQHKLAEILAKFDLESVQNERVKNLSDFHKFCVAIARICIRQADLLLVDGVFEACCDKCLALLIDLVDNWAGTAVVLSADISKARGNVLLISDSKVLAQGDPEKVKAEHQKLLWLHDNQH